MNLHNAGRCTSKVALFCLTFFAIIPIKIKLAGFNIGVSLLIMGILSLIYFFNYKINKKVGNFLVLISVIFIYFLVVSVFGGSLDYSMPIMFIYGTIFFTGALTLVRFFILIFNSLYVEKALKYIFFIGSLHALIQVAVIFSNELSGAIYQYIIISDDAITHLLQGYRSTGLFYSGAATLSTFNAVILLLGICIYLLDAKNIKYRYIFLIAVIFTLELMAIFFSGRTGFIVLLIGFLAYFFHSFINNILVSFMKNIFKVLIMLFIITNTALIFIDISVFQKNIEWAFEFLYGLSGGAKITTASTDLLFKTMFFLPPDTIDLIFGTANFGRSPNLKYIDSDSGYILLIFGSGLIGLIFAFSLFAYIYFITNTNKNTIKSNTGIAVFTRILILILIVANLKDFYYLANNGITQILMICTALILSSNKFIPRKI